MFLFKTKKSNLIELNTFFVVWFSGLIIGGGPLAIISLMRGRLRDSCIVLFMLAVGAFIYGLNRIGLDIAYREAPAATSEDIETARKMLYGDKK